MNSGNVNTIFQLARLTVQPTLKPFLQRINFTNLICVEKHLSVTEWQVNKFLVLYGWFSRFV